jgi:MFS family permease
MSGSKGWVTNTPDAPHSDGETPSAARSTTTLTMVFVGCIGVIATTMYASQPLLGLIGPATGLGQSWLGLIPTVTMFGYSVGLLLPVPLLDRLENRRLILAMMSLCASAISGAALAINVWGFLGTSFLIGVGACAIQMLVPISRLERASRSDPRGDPMRDDDWHIYLALVCAENPIRLNGAMESPKLAE